MKKLIVFFTLMGITVISIMAQNVPDSTGLVVVSGGTMTEFLQRNAWMLATVLVAFIDAALTQTGAIKESNILSFLWNMVIKIVYKRGQVKTTKAKFMNEKDLDQILKSKKK
jgi:hypothetical protein